jgi:hypothetical protein
MNVVMRRYDRRQTELEWRIHEKMLQVHTEVHRRILTGELGNIVTLDGNPANRATGHPSPVALLAGFPLFFFWGGAGNHFFLKKCVPICLLVSRCTHTLSILLFNVFHQRKLVIMTKTRGYIEVLEVHTVVSTLNRRSRYE